MCTDENENANVISPGNLCGPFIVMIKCLTVKNPHLNTVHSRKKMLSVEEVCYILKDAMPSLCLVLYFNEIIVISFSQSIYYHMEEVVNQDDCKILCL